MLARAVHVLRRISTRRAFERVVLLAVLVGLGLVAKQQRETADTLAQAVQVMVAAKGAPLVEPPTNQALPPPSPGVASVSTPPKPLRPAVDREAMEREAVSALASNDFELAFAKYQALATQFPGFPPYRQAAVVLRTQLGCGHWPPSDQGRCP